VFLVGLVVLFCFFFWFFFCVFCGGFFFFPRSGSFHLDILPRLQRMAKVCLPDSSFCSVLGRLVDMLTPTHPFLHFETLNRYVGLCPAFLPSVGKDLPLPPVLKAPLSRNPLSFF